MSRPATHGRAPSAAAICRNIVSSPLSADCSRYIAHSDYNFVLCIPFDMRISFCSPRMGLDGVAALVLSDCFIKDFMHQLYAKIRMCIHVRNSFTKVISTNPSVDEIGEHYRLNHTIVLKLYHPITELPRNVRLCHWRIATCFGTS